ncbi:hypothetical protein [Selenomonas bovis]|uniref:hypothetical protein n=1 Tax=Selenomonas bovis TaxID=416586 RepID=UPI00036E6DA0|nr:hypothetical protein [Selenomonas bovis]
MEKLNFTFNEELFGALRKDWKKQVSVEDAIEYFLNDEDVEEIRVSNGKGFDRHDDFQVLIDTRYANCDNKNDEYLILEIYDEISLRPILLPIKHDKKLVFKKRGSVVYVGLE